MYKDADVSAGYGEAWMVVRITAGEKAYNSMLAITCSKLLRREPRSTPVD